MSFRRLIWSTHRYCGLAAAFFLVIAAASRSILVFRAQLDVLLNPALLLTANRPVQPATALADVAQRAHPEWHIRGFDLIARPGHALCLQIAPLADDLDRACIDPADAHVTGLRSSAAAAARAGSLQAIYVLHYTMFAGTAGRLFMGLIALLWLFLNILGVFITMPRKRPRLRAWAREAFTCRGSIRMEPRQRKYKQNLDTTFISESGEFLLLSRTYPAGALVMSAAI